MKRFGVLFVFHLVLYMICGGRACSASEDTTCLSPVQLLAERNGKRLYILEHSGARLDLFDLEDEKIVKTWKRAYRALELSGYARLDLRLQEDGQFFLIEANPNPQLALDEELAESAHHAGIKYEPLLNKIVSLGLAYRAHWARVDG